MTPAQTMYLQQQTDELMWRAADAISLRGQQSDPASSTAEASTPPVKLEQPGMLGAKSEAAPQSSSLHAASSGLGSSGLGSEPDKGRPTEAQSGAVDLTQVTLIVPTQHNCRQLQQCLRSKPTCVKQSLMSMQRRSFVLTRPCFSSHSLPTSLPHPKRDALAVQLLDLSTTCVTQPDYLERTVQAGNRGYWTVFVIQCSLGQN